MGPLSLSILLHWITTVSLGGIYYEEECDRVRRPFHLQSDDELKLYVTGLQQIRANGKYQIMVDAHSQYTEIHRGSSFFFYHTYFVWEVETQIRLLGGDYSCFAMPYYDWTVDSGRERHPSILYSVFGGDGDSNDFQCVTDPHHKLWGTDKWPLRELCGPQEDPESGCCLKRNLDPHQKLMSAPGMVAILGSPEFHHLLGGVLMQHQKVHWLFGTGSECQNCAMATGYSPDDPIFMMLHSFTAYLRALWASCNGYDKLEAMELGQDDNVYVAECIDGYTECGAVELDDAYDFGKMADFDWSLTSKMEITPRTMWHFQDWGVRYDHGSFLEKSGLTESPRCSEYGVAQSEWFFNRAAISSENDGKQGKEHVMKHKQVRRREEVLRSGKKQNVLLSQPLNHLKGIGHHGSDLDNLCAIGLLVSVLLLVAPLYRYCGKQRGDRRHGKKRNLAIRHKDYTVRIPLLQSYGSLQ